MSAGVARVRELEALWQAALWAAAAVGLALGGGIALACVVAVLALLAQLERPHRAAQLALAALRGVGLSLWALQLPLPLVLALALAVAALWLRHLRWPLWWAGVALGVLGLPLLLAQSGGKGEAPSPLLWLRLGAALLLVADALATQRLRPQLGRRSAVLLAAAVLVGVALRGLGALPVLPAPRYDAAAFEAARLGQQRRAAALLEAAICQQLDRGESLPAERLLRWGTLLAPQRFQTADGRLWRAEQLFRRDPAQARAIAERVRRGSSRSELLAAVGRADPTFVTWLRDGWQGEQPALAAALAALPAASAPRCAEVPR